jgi:hypothetical protein
VRDRNTQGALGGKGDIKQLGTVCGTLQDVQEAAVKTEAAWKGSADLTVSCPVVGATEAPVGICPSSCSHT